jgi:hypothetical protein
VGLFLLDIFGNEVLLHREAPGCFQPVPLAARPRPPIAPDRLGLLCCALSPNHRGRAQSGLVATSSGASGLIQQAGS